jgi:hypothetical protein
MTVALSAHSLATLQTTTCTLDALSALDLVIKYGFIGGIVGAVSFYYLFGNINTNNADPIISYYTSYAAVVLVRSSIIAVVISVVTAIFLRYVAPISIRACSDLPIVGI